MYGATIGTIRYVFPDLKTLMAKATPTRSSDRLAGVAAAAGEERVAAQYALADLPLATFLTEPVVPYESDEVTRLIVDTHDAAAFAPIAHLTVGSLRGLAPVRRPDRRRARRARSRHHAGNGGGGEQDQPSAGSHGDGGEV